MVKSYSSLLDRLGRELTSEVGPLQKRWISFLRATPEAVGLAREFRSRYDEIVFYEDTLPADFYPDWDLERRLVSWTVAGDRQLGTLAQQLFELWFASEGSVFNPEKIKQAGLGDRGHWLWLERLPDPLADDSEAWEESAPA